MTPTDRLTGERTRRSRWGRLAMQREEAQARLNLAARRVVRLESGPEDAMELACAIADLDSTDRDIADFQKENPAP